MLRFVLRRVLLVLPVLFGLLVLTFVLVRVVPNDPSAALAGQNATPQLIAEIRTKYGFDRPLIVQFGIYLRQVVQADLGTSIQSGRPVARDIRQRLPATLELTFAALRHLALPAVTLSLGAMATITRFTRSGVLETLQKEYVLYEIAAGYPRGLLIAVYVLRNSLVATITQIGLLFGALLAGAVVVESIFDWPGIGSYAVSAIFTSDYKAILAVTLLVGIVYSIVNIAVDLLHGLIDPRVAEQL